jgi:hypothetical protein
MANEPARELRPDPPYRGSRSPDPDENPAISRLKSGDIVVTVPGGTGQPARTRRRDGARAADVGARRLVAIATLTPLVIVIAIVVWLVWLR